LQRLRDHAVDFYTCAIHHGLAGHHAFDAAFTCYAITWYVVHGIAPLVG
jgi:hypothetical protein